MQIWYEFNANYYKSVGKITPLLVLNQFQSFPYILLIDFRK